MRWLYLTAAILGAVLPLAFLIPFVAEHGLDMRLFFGQLFQTNISSFFAMDVLVSSVVLWLLVVSEGRRLGMRHLWVYIVSNLLVGVSLGLPLFLYFRERKRAAVGRAFSGTA